MKTKICLILAACLYHSLALHAQQQKFSSTPEKVSEEWYSKASEYIARLEYDFYHYGTDAFRVTNQANRIGFFINEKGYTVYPLKSDGTEDWHVTFTLQSIGRATTAFDFSQRPIVSERNGILLQQFALLM